MHAPFRVATERTRFAMPETDIGYFTDVGSTHFLSHLDGQLGTYLGLTSSQVIGRQVLCVLRAKRKLKVASLTSLIIYQ